MCAFDDQMPELQDRAAKLDATLSGLVSGQNYRLDYLGADIRPDQPEPNRDGITASVAMSAVNLRDAVDEAARIAVEGVATEAWSRTVTNRKAGLVAALAGGVVS